MVKSGIFLLLFTCPLFSQEALSDEIAIVKCVEGNALFRRPDSQHSQTVKPLQWHVVGTRIETGSQSQLDLVFLNGSQMRLMADSIACLTESGLSLKKGQLAAVDSHGKPMVAPIANGDQTPDYSGVVRIRSTGLAFLYPFANATVLADHPVIAVQTKPTGLLYDLQIENGQGRLVYQIRSSLQKPQIPSTILAPDNQYYIRVRPVHPRISYSWFESPFKTLSRKNEVKRIGLKDALDLTNPSDLYFAAIVDRGMGLYWESSDLITDVVDASQNSAYDVVGPYFAPMARFSKSQIR